MWTSVHRAPGQNRIPGDEIFNPHAAEYGDCFLDFAVLPVGYDHGVADMDNVYYSAFDEQRENRADLVCRERTPQEAPVGELVRVESCHLHGSMG